MSIPDGVYLFRRADVTVERRDNRWHVVESLNGSILWAGRPHRWRWQAKREARRRPPSYYPTEITKHVIGVALDDRGTSMRLHERTLPVQKASVAIRTALDALQQEHDLTDVEMLRVLLEHQQTITKYLLRDERHPDDPRT